MLAVLLFCLGLIGLTISRRFKRSRLRDEAWRSRAAPAEGRVEVPTEFFDLSTRQYRVYGPGDDPPDGKVIFKAKDGREYAIVAAYGANAGDKARVLYDPESPSTATLDLGPPNRSGESLTRLVAGLFFAAAFAAFWMDR